MFTGFGTASGPVKIDDDGNVLWYGEWDDPDGDLNSGLFLNDTLLVQEGVTTIDGLVVDTISSGSDAFSMSDDGEWALFEATLAGGINGAFAIQFGAALLGDVNGDEEVNLLDVAPFVDLLSNGGFQVEADINCDGFVNLLDVKPFVALLAGP